MAHSMGGFVTSRYIADGNGDRIRRLITVRTLFLGTPKIPYVFATGRLITQWGIGIATSGIRTITSHLISAYQLLPFQNEYTGYISMFPDIVGLYNRYIYI